MRRDTTTWLPVRWQTRVLPKEGEREAGGVGGAAGAVEHGPPTVNLRCLKALITQIGLQSANTCRDKIQ